MDSSQVPLLLVEDEPDLRDALGEYLGACGFAVTAAATAGEASQAARIHPPRLILTDLSLPDLRGDTLLEEFHQEHPDCLLYVHSGDSTFFPSPRLQAIGLAPDHIFSKPADLAAMVVRLMSDLAAVSPLPQAR